jgi:hypothetical protein
LLLPLAWESREAEKFELVFLSYLLIGLECFIVNTIGRIILEQSKNSTLKKVSKVILKLVITVTLLVAAAININEFNF